MIPTIEVEIDSKGQVHLIDPVDHLPVGRVLLTLIDDKKIKQTNKQPGLAEDIISLLKTKRYANRPKSSHSEVEHRITSLRNDWDID
jgi:hypothetical protein